MPRPVGACVASDDRVGKMKKIINPWAGEPTYHCYGCDPNNDHGLKMEFYEDGDDIVCHWHPRQEFESWRNTLHGGVQAVLVDEIASWVIFRKFQTSGVTSHLEMRYKKQVVIAQDHITLRARVTRQRRQAIDINVELYDAQGELCTEGHCIYFLTPRQRACEEHGFQDFLTEDEI